MANINMLNAIASADFECQTDKLLLYFLATNCFNNEHFEPNVNYTMPELAKACGIKDRTAIFKSIQRLEKSGWLRCIQKGNKLPNIYVLLEQNASKSYPQHVAQNQHHSKSDVAHNQHRRCSESTSHVAQNQHPSDNTPYNILKSYNMNNSYKGKSVVKKNEKEREPVLVSRLLHNHLAKQRKENKK